MKFDSLIILMLTTSLVWACPAMAIDLDVSGVWLTADRDGHVEIRDCGNATPCGQLVWFDPAKRGGLLETRNPALGLRTRPLIGVPIFRGFERHQNDWIGGTIYNPVDGKTFSAKLRLGRDGTLIVTGCLGPICITRRWTRVG